MKREWCMMRREGTFGPDKQCETSPLRMPVMCYGIVEGSEEEDYEAGWGTVRASTEKEGEA